MKKFASLALFTQQAETFGYVIEKKNNARLGDFHIAKNAGSTAGSFCAAFPKDSYMLLPTDSYFKE